MQYPIIAQPQYGFAPTMPTFEGGGRVAETYGLRNVAEQLRERGRDGDTILAHINPEEAGILKLLGGSGTINPYTGLPEFKPFYKKIIPKPVYKLGSKVGKEIERGVEKVAQNKILGPIAQMAAAYFGGPLGAGLYAGLAKPGSSFDVKNAAKAAAVTYAAGQINQAMNANAPAGGGIGSEGASMSDLNYSGYGGPGGYGPGGFDADIGLDVMSGGPGSAPPPVASSYSFSDPLAGTSSINYPPDPSSYVSGADAGSTYASTGTPTSDAGLGSLPAEASTPTQAYDAGQDLEVMNQPSSGPADYMGEPGAGPTTASGQTSPDTRSALRQGYDSVKQGYNAAADTVERGIKSVIPEPIQDAYGATRDFVKDLIPPDYRETLSTVKDIAMIGSGASAAYGAYEMKKELEKQKEEADRIMRDRENRKQEEIEWAQGVISSYPTKYERLTAEEVTQERGMARGGIASLAKGGLPPRYLRGGGDGMSDSIRANIDGKQEARLADGEFVIPADVVSHLGNGSSNAGAKKLYAMMSRARKSRTGKTSQAPEVNTRRLMPV